MSPHDPFGTAALRQRVLDAWAASPSRFREDANAEEDLVRGGYRDRVVVELAQNATDAATRAGAPGRLLLQVAGDVLRAANTGAPLDRAGVESLSSLRASAKRSGESVGRFGVGFAAVLTVSDEPRIASLTGGARWDAGAAQSAVAAVPSLAEELARRGGHVPALRLPFPWTGEVPDGYATAVELPLRDQQARALVERLLADVDDTLLLALPGLDEVVVEIDGVRRVIAPGTWQVARRGGVIPAHLLADRPVEERDRPHWSVTWARPLDGRPVPVAVHAPTPTDEPLDFPVLLLASFPLDPTRRHVAAGPLTDWLVGQAASAYAQLVVSVADADDRLALVPRTVAAGRLDGQLRAAVLGALRETAWLTAADGSTVAPRDAVAVTGAPLALLEVCADAVTGLVRDTSALRRLDVRRLDLADLVEQLADLDRPPAWWRSVYAAVAAGPVDAEALRSLPVPLADGRTVRSPRGVLVGSQELPVETARAAGALGVRLVHPEAAHDVLLRLGAESATPLAVLRRPEVREAITSAWDEPDPVAVTDAVLSLVAASGAGPGDLATLAGLPLPDVEGELAAADELAMPGSLLAGLADPSAVGVVAEEYVDRWGAGVLQAVGVLAELTVGEVHDVVLDRAVPPADEELALLPALTDWVADVAPLVPPGAVAPVVRGIRELDVVSDDRWVELLTAVAGDPAARSALLTPVVVAGAGGRTIPSYAAVTGRLRARLAGRPPTAWALPGSELAGLYPPLAVPVAPELLAAIGVRTSTAALVAEPGGAEALLERLAGEGAVVTSELLANAYVQIARLDAGTVDPPARLRVGPGLTAAATDVVVVDEPAHLQLDWTAPLVVPLALAAGLADVLDVPVSSEVVRGRVESPGESRPVPPVAGVLLPAVPGEWFEHETLLVDDVEVTWWVDDDGAVHASTVDGLARGLAWAADRWDRRWAVEAVLVDPRRLDEVDVELRLES